jgi:hypothetical protein
MCAALVPSCSVYYFEPDGTGVLWGVGRLEVRVTEPSESKQQAICRRLTLTGFSIGYDGDGVGMSLGLDRRERVVITSPSTVLGLRRSPDGSLFRMNLVNPAALIVEVADKVPHDLYGHITRKETSEDAYHRDLETPNVAPVVGDPDGH